MARMKQPPVQGGMNDCFLSPQFLSPVFRLRWMVGRMAHTRLRDATGLIMSEDNLLKMVQLNNTAAVKEMQDTKDHQQRVLQLKRKLESQSAKALSSFSALAGTYLHGHQLTHTAAHTYTDVGFI